MRYRQDGSLDSSFSGKGKTLTDLGRTEFAGDVALAPGGGTVVGGSSFHEDDDDYVLVLSDQIALRCLGG